MTARNKPSLQTAHNKPGFLAAQELHAAVRDILADLCCPRCRGRPPTKLVKARLPPHLRDRDDRTIREHVKRVLEEESAKEKVDGHDGNLSVDLGGALSTSNRDEL